MNQKELLQKVLDASKVIDKSSRNSNGNYIITSSEVFKNNNRVGSRTRIEKDISK